MSLPLTLSACLLLLFLPASPHQANKHFDKEAALREAENVVKAKQASYVKDDFFDMMSCETLDKMGQGDGPHYRRSVQVREGRACLLDGVGPLVEPRSRGKHGRLMPPLLWTAVADGCVLRPCCLPAAAACCGHRDVWGPGWRAPLPPQGQGPRARRPRRRLEQRQAGWRRLLQQPAGRQGPSPPVSSSSSGWGRLVFACVQLSEGMSRAHAVLSGSTTGACSAGSSSSSILGWWLLTVVARPCPPCW